MPATNQLLQEGRYRIDQRANGSENVYEAYDTVRHANVIVLEIPVKMNRVMTVSQQESLKVAFSGQAKALTEIQHDSLPPVHDFFSEIDRQYLVIEAIDGPDLSALLAANRRPFSITEVTLWADELLDALNYLHTRKPSIIHRNIKPHNLKLSNGKLKLLGFGLVNGSDASSTDDLRYSPMEHIWPGLDPASQKVITNSYDDRSERILKEPLDARSDIYSLGATLYFLATGVEPVDPLERSIDILEGKLDPLREPTSVNSQIAPEVSDVLMKALEIKRENRYDSALIMRQVLQAAIARVEEREQSVSADQTEAADMIRRSAEAKNFVPIVEAPRATEPPPRVQETVQHQPPQPSAAPVAFREEPVEASSVPARNLVEMPVAEDVVAYRETEAVDEDELAAVLREIEEAESRVVVDKPEQMQETASPVIEQPIVEQTVVEELVVDEPVAEIDEHADAQTFGEVIDSSPQPAVAATTAYHTEDDDEDIFSIPEKSGLSLPLPAIAGAIGLVVMIGVGGWFAMSGSSEPPKPAAVQVENIQEPVPADPAPATTDTLVSDQPGDPAISAAAVSDSSQDQVGAQRAPTPKPKKNDAVKAADKKKAVTVDDLINDN